MYSDLITSYELDDRRKTFLLPAEKQKISPFPIVSGPALGLTPPPIHGYGSIIL
jgi:hypothetical protein